MAGLAVRGYSRKGGKFSKTQSKDEVLQKGGRLPLSSYLKWEEKGGERNVAEGGKEAHWNRRQRNKGVEMIGVYTQHKTEKLVRSLQNAGCLEKAKTCFDCFSSCSCQLVLYSASLAPLPLRLPQSALWWITAGNSSCRYSLNRGKLISSGVSSFLAGNPVKDRQSTGSWFF